MANSTFHIALASPPCWNGELTSNNFMSHLAEPIRDKNTGILECPDTHPYEIPKISFLFHYTLPEGVDARGLTTSSDMHGMPPGSNWHADYMDGWHPVVKKMWFDHALQQLLNTSGGDLGNGMGLFAYEKRSYTYRPNLVDLDYQF